jgi:hypothetical protein
MIRRYVILIYVIIVILFFNEENFLSAYSFPLVLSVKVPSFMRGYCAPHVSGGYRGRMCDLLSTIFTVYSNNYRFVLEYFDSEDDDLYDIILYMDKNKPIKNKFFYSTVLFDTVPFFVIRKNNFSLEEGGKKIIINDSILINFALKEEKKDYIVVSSLEEGLQKLLLCEAQEFLLDPSFFPAEYSDALRYLGQREDSFEYQKIYKKIQPVYLVFNYHFFWFYRIFVRGLFRAKRRSGLFSSFNYNMLL